MKKKGIFLLVVLVLLAGPVGVHATVGPPPSRPPPPPPNCNSMMAPAAQNALYRALEFKEKAHALLDQAAEKGLDISEIEALIAGADALVEKAQKIVRANPIPANNMLIEAADMYENAISDLEGLLG